MSRKGLDYLKSLTEKLITCNEPPKSFSLDWISGDLKKSLSKVNSIGCDATRKKINRIVSELCENDKDESAEASDGN